MKFLIFILVLFFIGIISSCDPNTNINHPHVFAPIPDTLRMHKVYIGNDSTALFLPEDLTASLWAETPMLYNPTNMDVDYKGRIWITEAVNYRDFNNPDSTRLYHKQGDRVMILEDTDDDGIADSSKVFVQDTDLVAPLGIAVIGNKIIVSCSPNLIMYTDDNGDDIPDHKEIILSGFGGHDHDHSLHSVVAGPDGQWYFNTGNAGPHTVKDKNGWTLRSGSMYTGGSPYNQVNEGNQKSDDGRTWVGGLSLRMNKDIKDLKVMAHNFRNSYEITVDSYGNLWQNDNDDQVMACRTSYLMEGGSAGFFSKDGTRSWQGDRRPWQSMFDAHWHQDDPGAMPVSDNAGAGSPTGMAINESDALGSRYRGMVLSAEAGRNTIYAYWPQPHGAGYSMKRHNLISTLSQDNVNYQWNNDIVDKKMWFRPSDICFGTDGALYIADWYDPVVGGHDMRDTLGYGRIIRIAPTNKKLSNPKIDLSSNEGTLSAIKSPAINVRNQSVELIKQSDQAEILVNELLKDKNTYIQSRAIYLLAEINPVKANAYLKNENENLRIAAFRSLKTIPQYLIPSLDVLLLDTNKRVLREVAIALRDLPYAQSKKYIEKLVELYPNEDAWYDAAFGIACDGKEEKVYHEIIKPQLTEGIWADNTIRQLFTLHPASAVPDIITQINKNQNPAIKSKLLTALAFIRDTSSVKAMINYSNDKDSLLSSQAFWWLNFRKTNDWAKLYDWSSLNSLSLSDQQKTILGLQEIVLNSKKETDQINAAVTLASSAEGGKILLSLAGNNKIKGKVRDTISKVIGNNPDASVRAMASDMYWRSTGTRSYQYSTELISKMRPDIEKGKMKFDLSCGTCHRKNNVGKNIGPDLSAIGQKLDPVSLIDAIINPSAGIAFGYELTTLKTKDNKNYFGFVVGDGETITFKDITGMQHTIPKSSIVSKKSVTNSLMPPAHQLNLTDRDVANIVRYLRKQ